MTTTPEIDTQSMLDFLVALLEIPSPTGYTEAAIGYCESALRGLPLRLARTRKGALVATWEGASDVRPRGITGHVDTLGALVKEINGNGRLTLARIGGFAWNTIEGEGVTVLTRSGDKLRGAFLPRKASVHIHGGEVGKQDRSDATAFEVRLDARTHNAEETRALGVEVGDFVAFDPRVEIGAAGFVRSRHLDDKAAVAAMLGAAQAIVAAGKTPAQRTTLLISNYEEVGHGAAAGWPGDLHELVSVDMAAVGAGQNSDEFSVGICVADSGGPYHDGLRSKLARLAEAAHIPYRLDIYPHYGSDGEAYWRAGGDVQVALMGPGVDASHSYERTHTESIENTARLLVEYMLQP